VQVSEQDCRQRVYRITDNQALDSDPSWSPDGKQLAFVSQRGGDQDIYILPVDCQAGILAQEANSSQDWPLVSCVGEPQQLTSDPGPDGSPSWSPDGSRIAFVSRREDSNDIYLMDSTGENLQRLTDSLSEERFPVWSPDGRWLAFGARQDVNTNEDIKAIHLESRQTRQLTSHPAGDFWPAWSPDGRWLAFESAREVNEREVYILDLACLEDAGPDQPLEGGCAAQAFNFTQHEGFDSTPGWSPDSRAIVFRAFRNQNWDLYVQAFNP
jgi:TolB protein